jgi:hypothetical protein
MMTCCSRVRHAILVPSVRLAVAGALIYAGGVAAPAMASPYPPPGGIFAPFTDCPLKNRILRQAAPGFAMGCIKSITASGTFTVNGIPVPITQPVTVQFGTYSDQDSSGNQVFHVVPTRDKNKELITEPEVIPNGLLLLVCSTGDPAVAELCQKAINRGQTDLTVQVKLAGPITNFSPLAASPFTLPVKVSLGNPLLGKCSIGSDSDPIVLNPLFNPIGTLSFEPDPDPVQFPNVAVLGIKGSTLTDDTFTVPAATRCGTGEVANAPINAFLGLPSPSGNNHLVLNGNNALFADDFSQSNQAQDLLAAFLASVGVPPASPSGAFLD